MVVRSAAGGAGSMKQESTTLDYGALDGRLGYQLRRAFLRSNQLFAKLAGQAEVAPGQFGVLVLIDRNPGRSQTEVAAASGLDRSTLTLMLDQLAGKGWIERRPGPDRRTFSLYVTDPGRAAVAAAEPRVAEHEARVRADLTAAEAETLLALLKRVAGGAS